MLKRRRLIIISTAVVALTMLGIVTVASRRTEKTQKSQATESNTTATPVPEPTKTFDKQKYSIDEPSSIWVVANKQRPLPAGYVPANLTAPNAPVRSGGDEGTLRSDAATALEALISAAKSNNHNLMLVSGYRSYGLQVSVYGGYVQTLGQSEANRISARPGTSEHQTGLSADVGTTDRLCELEICFGKSVAGKWTAANAYKFGFVTRYPEGKEDITGYSYEPWHLRYVGKELAAEIKRTGDTTTLEEFFGL